MQRDEELTSEIKTIFWWSRETYGVPRIYEELKAKGTITARKRIARLMKQHQLRGVTRRRHTH